MSKKWFSGPPPSVGWWPCLDSDELEGVRWWNGSKWSVRCFEEDPLHRIDHYAGLLSCYSNRNVRWQHRPESWPERSKT